MTTTETAALTSADLQDLRTALQRAFNRYTAQPSEANHLAVDAAIAAVTMTPEDAEASCAYPQDRDGEHDHDACLDAVETPALTEENISSVARLWVVYGRAGAVAAFAGLTEAQVWEAMDVLEGRRFAAEAEEEELSNTEPRFVCGEPSPSGDVRCNRDADHRGGHAVHTGTPDSPAVTRWNR